jgi:sugar/nucleoside kinase (ribokinase family)
MSAVDYLVIGHLSLDQVNRGTARMGGSVAYAGGTALALGCRVAAVTSAVRRELPPRPVPGMRWRRVPARRSTRFESLTTAAGRQLRLLGRAAPLVLADVPRAWRRAAIVHLAPIAGEVDPQLVQRLDAALIGLTPQGWLRRWDGGGGVRPRFWPLAETVFPRASAVILSEEDLESWRDLDAYRRWARLLVLTQGRRGCTVFWDGTWRQVDAARVAERDATGAGDIFAAAFLTHLWRHADPWRAARFANAVAAPSVTRCGLHAKLAAIRNARFSLADPRETM